MKKLAILILAGLMFLPTAFMGAVARPTVINVNFTGDVGEHVQDDITLNIHGFGFPGEALDWEGTLVMPADHITHPAAISNIVMTEADYSATFVSGSFVLADSNYAELNGCFYQFGANVNGKIGIESQYQPPCPDLYLDPFSGQTATVVINM